MTPTDLIPADTLAALPMWSSDDLQAALASKLTAAAAAMRWDWIPPGEEFSLTIRGARSLLPNDSDVASDQVSRLFPDWRVAVHPAKSDMELEFFPIRGFVAESVTGNNLSGDLMELTVAELKAELAEKLETALGR